MFTWQLHCSLLSSKRKHHADCHLVDAVHMSPMFTYTFPRSLSSAITRWTFVVEHNTVAERLLRLEWHRTERDGVLHFWTITGMQRQNCIAHAFHSWGYPLQNSRACFASEIRCASASVCAQIPHALFRSSFFPLLIMNIDSCVFVPRCLSMVMPFFRNRYSDQHLLFFNGVAIF